LTGHFAASHPMDRLVNSSIRTGAFRFASAERLCPTRSTTSSARSTRARSSTTNAWDTCYKSCSKYSPNGIIAQSALLQPPIELTEALSHGISSSGANGSVNSRLKTWSQQLNQKHLLHRCVDGYAKRDYQRFRARDCGASAAGGVRLRCVRQFEKQIRSKQDTISAPSRTTFVSGQDPDVCIWLKQVL